MADRIASACMVFSSSSQISTYAHLMEDGGGGGGGGGCFDNEGTLGRRSGITYLLIPC